MGVFEQLEEIRKTPTSPMPLATTSVPTISPSPPSVSSQPTPANNAVETLPTPSDVPTAVPIAPTSEPPFTSAPERPMGRSPVRRIITRHSFELFQDQIDALRRLALEEKLVGDKGNMSEMAREAIDAYLAKRKRNPR